MKHFEWIETNKDFGKIYTQRLPGLGKIKAMESSLSNQKPTKGILSRAQPTQKGHDMSYKHGVVLGRSNPNSSRSTAGSALTPSSAIGAAAFFAFCFYLMYKVIDLVIRPILLFLFRMLSKGARNLYRNRKPIAQAIARTTTKGYHSARHLIETRQRARSSQTPN